MDWNSAFNADPPNANTKPIASGASNMKAAFEAKAMMDASALAKQHKPLVAKGVDTAKNLMAKMASAMYTPEENAILAIDPKADIQLTLKWTKDWDSMFASLSNMQTTLSNKMLDLTQEISVELSKQTETFEDLQICVKFLDELFKPKSTGFFGGLFGSSKEIAPDDGEIQEGIEEVQQELGNLVVELNPFLQNSISAMQQELIKTANQFRACVTSMEYIKSKLDEDVYNRRLLRIESMRGIMHLAEAGMEQCTKQVMHRQQVLEDYKMQAIPMVVLKLQQYLLNKDASAMKGAFDDILKTRLE